MSEVDVVRLVLARHEHQCQPINELHAIQGVDTHVHQNTIQDRHGDILQYRCKFYREASKQENTNTGHTLLSEKPKHCRFVSDVDCLT